jgi:hypothetical protein
VLVEREIRPLSLLWVKDRSIQDHLRTIAELGVTSWLGWERELEK